ncbi:MAG: hypothetical protein IH971_07625, partial [Candidatus Marinimicrobia bacterium]|nr:hypothetical protein [Candidatus Neomarinimicrobiota bacterium]
LYSWLYGGTRLVLAESRETIVRDCQLAQPTVLNGVPYFYQKIAQQLQAAGETGKRGAIQKLLSGNLKHCFCGGAAVAPEVESLFAEQGLQITGCVSNECAIEVGRLLGAQLMLVGAISKFGSTYSIDIRMIDVETGRITVSVPLDFRGEFGLLLTKGVSEVVQLITGGSIPDLVETTSEPTVKLRTEVLNTAVVEFQEKGSLGIEDAGTIVAEWMSSSLYRTGTFSLYERVLLQKVLEEQELGLTGALDEQTTAEIGKVYGVEAIVTGTISKFGNTISVVVKLIDTNTAKVMAIADVKTESLSTIPDKIDELAWELAKEPEP